jgi:hypothetical protein
MNGNPNISKSKFLHGLQCPKLIWSAFNAKHLFPDVDGELQAIFDQGQEDGSLAKKMLPDGVEIDADLTDIDGIRPRVGVSSGCPGGTMDFSRGQATEGSAAPGAGLVGVSVLEGRRKVARVGSSAAPPGRILEPAASGGDACGLPPAYFHGSSRAS